MSRPRLRLERSRDRIIVVGTRPVLVLAPGEGGTIRWLAEREVRDWRRHFGTMRCDLARVDEALAAYGLRLAVPGEWDRAVAAAEVGR